MASAILEAIYAGTADQDTNEAGPDRETRLRHVRCAALILSNREPVARVAAMFGISRRTAFYWVRKALGGYDDDEAEALRRVVMRTPGRWPEHARVVRDYHAMADGRNREP